MFRFIEQLKLKQICQTVDAGRPTADFDQVKRKIWAIAYADLRDPKLTSSTSERAIALPRCSANFSCLSRPRPLCWNGRPNCCQ